MSCVEAVIFRFFAWLTVWLWVTTALFAALTFLAPGAINATIGAGICAAVSSAATGAMWEEWAS